MSDEQTQATQPNPLVYTWRWVAARLPGGVGGGFGLPPWLVTTGNSLLWAAVGACILALSSRIDFADVVPLPDVAEFPELAGEVKSITCRLDLEPDRGQLDAMAAAIRETVAGSEAATCEQLTGEVNRALALGGDEDWMDWGAFVQTELIIRQRAGKLLTVADYKAALEQVAAGLVQAKECT